MEDVTISIDIFWSVLIVAVLGLLVVGAIVAFAWKAFSDDPRGFVSYESLLDFLTTHKI